MIQDKLGLEILQEVIQIANSTLDLDETLRGIIEVIKNKMPGDACAIYLAEEDGKFFHLKASSGLPKEATQIKLESGKGITGWVAQKKISVALSDAIQDPRFIYFPQIEEERFKSMLSVPLLAEDQCIGVINVHTVEKRTISALEIAILEAISKQVSGSLRNAILYHKNQRSLKELTILYDISMAVQSTIKLEHGVWLILSGITMGEAGGFNRAMLFTLDDESKTLKGFMGLGPDTSDDAVRVWTELDKKGGHLLQWIIQEADREEFKQSSFNQYVRSLKFPAHPEGGVFAQTVLQKKIFNITDAQNDPTVDNEFALSLGCNAFVTAPLIAHEEVLGVILADNRFTHSPITEEQIRYLARFASHASWVMENSRLFSKLLDTNLELLSTKEQLSQTEKLATLGEISAEVAHEIKNPLVSIGGFARRLKDKIGAISQESLNDLGLETAGNYTNIIAGEVVRLENLLENILGYSKSGEVSLEASDLNRVLDEVLFLFKSGFYEKNISLNCELAPGLPRVRLDKHKFKQVLINLIYNAMESMTQGGLLTVQTYIDEYSPGLKMITVRLQDSGGGIPQEVFENIFNPFFTTKKSGTGLGLSICRKIIENHGGNIRVENRMGQGVAVFLHLPLQ